MTHARPADPLKTPLQPGPECLDPMRFESALTDPEQAHVNGCARCRTELTLFREFEESTPSPDEGAAVQWVVRELGRRQAAGSAGPAPVAAVRSWWTGLFSRSMVPALAALSLVAVVSYLAWDSEPRLRDVPSQSTVYRTGLLKVVEPVGDKKEAPSTFEWEAVQGGVKYDVSLLEVDGNLLWQASVAETRVSLPAAIRQQLVPGKTLLWKVVARSASGAVVAESETQRFRVAL